MRKVEIVIYWEIVIYCFVTADVSSNVLQTCFLGSSNHAEFIQITVLVGFHGIREA